MRDEFFDTCGLCDAPLRMGQRCACGDNWRATPPAPAQPPHSAYHALIHEAARLLQLRTYGDPVDVARSSFIDNALCDIAMELRRTAGLLPRAVEVGTQDEPKGDALGSADEAKVDAQPVSAEPPVPDGVWEALQRLIENAGAAGPASTEDALLVARYRRRLLAAPPALHEAVDILRKLLTHGWAEDCQECAIGQSSAWADAKALIARVDAARRDGGE